MNSIEKRDNSPVRDRPKMRGKERHRRHDIDGNITRSGLEKTVISVIVVIQKKNLMISTTYETAE